MDVNGDGVIRVDEFVQYFAQSLPDTKPEFDAVIRQFLEVAHSFRITKLKEQGVESTAPDPDNEELRAQLAELTREVSTLLSQKAAAEDEVVQQPLLAQLQLLCADLPTAVCHCCQPRVTECSVLERVRISEAW